MLKLLPLAAVGLALLPGRADAAVPFGACALVKKDAECATIIVPLDRTGIVPGQIVLHVERSLAVGPPRGVMLLVAGGPGQPSSKTFALGETAAGQRKLFPGYTLAAYDPRGTGESSPLTCPGIQGLFSTETDFREAADLAGACGTILGDNRRFYSTRDHAEDIEAVRQQLGIDKIAIWGTSYGTKVAVAYALAHPDHVDRLLLDSVVAPEGHDAFSTETMRELPKALASLCGGGACRDATPSFADDVVNLANRLGTKPVSGRVLLAGGKSRVETLDGVQFLTIVIEADLNPGIAAALPAAVRAALAGDPRALLRLNVLLGLGPQLAESINAALFAATVCDDGPFPWKPETPIPERQALFDAALKALPPASFGRFGSWSAGFGNAAFCRLWPAQPSPPAFTPLPLPDVPVLVLAGDRDSRTPVAAAASVAARFPHARLLIAPNVGHSVLGADLTGCAEKAVLDWMNGSATTPSRCPRSPHIVSPIAAFPSSVASLPPTAGVPGLAGKTLTAVSRTVREAGATWILIALGVQSEQTTVAGLIGGRLEQTSETPVSTLVRYSIVPGVEVSGRIFPQAFSKSSLFPLRFEGRFTIGGPRAAHGTLEFGAKRIRGTLNGRKIDVARG